jgi:hypothetical protein
MVRISYKLEEKLDIIEQKIDELKGFHEVNNKLISNNILNIKNNRRHCDERWIITKWLLAGIMSIIVLIISLFLV